jgi:4-oxalocrotonate tautomerase
MPIVRVAMLAGRSIEKKRKIVQGITEVVARVCEAPPDSVEVLIEELPRDDWAVSGTLTSDYIAAKA